MITAILWALAAPFAVFVFLRVISLVLPRAILSSQTCRFIGIIVHLVLV